MLKTICINIPIIIKNKLQIEYLHLCYRYLIIIRYAIQISRNSYFCIILLFFKLLNSICLSIYSCL
nr:MAG TPA: hypothetical protein [Bacteriophage sp.]